MLQEKIKEPDQPVEEPGSELVFFDTFSHDNEVCDQIDLAFCLFFNFRFKNDRRF